MDPDHSSTPSAARSGRRTAPGAGESRPLLKPVNTLGWTPKEKKITILARKSWNVLLHMAQNQGLEKQEFSTTLAQVVKGIDYGSNDLELIKKHLRGMVSTTVEWQSPTSGEGTQWTVCGLLSHASLTKVRGEIWVHWSYALNMRQELLEPRVFARLQLPILSQLRTHAALALYEICTRYKDIGRTARQSWHWWRPVLTGRPENEKTAKMEYRIFKRDCLRLAIAEVSAVTDLEIELVEYKAGRFISDLQFLVRLKSQPSLPFSDPPQPVDLELIRRAERLGVDSDRAEGLLEEFGEPALRSGLDALEKRLATAFPEPLRDHYRYLKSLMPGEAKRAVAQREVEAARTDPSSAAGKELQIRRQARWTEQWLRERRDKVIQEIESFSREEQANLVQELVLDMERRKVHPSIRKRLQTSGWTHQLVVHEMVKFYASAAHGDAWDRPTPTQILEVATRIGHENE